MSFCAICTTDRGPFVARPLGRDDAPVSICVDCDEDEAVSMRGPEIEREWSEMSWADFGRAIDAAHERMTGASPTNTHERIYVKAMQPGYILVRVGVRDGMGGTRDARSARKAFAAEPWAKDARHLGSTGRWHLFERPDPKIAAERMRPDDNPLEQLAELAKRSP